MALGRGLESLIPPQEDNRDQNNMEVREPAGNDSGEQPYQQERGDLQNEERNEAEILVQEEEVTAGDTRIRLME